MLSRHFAYNYFQLFTQNRSENCNMIFHVKVAFDSLLDKDSHGITTIQSFSLTLQLQFSKDVWTVRIKTQTLVDMKFAKDVR